MPAREISPRLQPLLTLGAPPEASGSWGSSKDVDDWLDYRAAFGLSGDDVDGLGAIAGDKVLSQSGEPACYAPMHAWRALRHFGEAAVSPLLEALDAMTRLDDDWAINEMPSSLAALGPVALPHLKRFLPDQRRFLWARVVAGEAMGLIAGAHPECRGEVIAALIDQLGRARYNDPVLSGSIVGALADLRAVEATSAITHAYRGGYVDRLMVGDLAGVLQEIGEEPGAGEEGAGDAGAGPEVIVSAGRPAAGSPR